jgi:imidazolonepropionase-like amidohydrolase
MKRRHVLSLVGSGALLWVGDALAQPRKAGTPKKPVEPSTDAVKAASKEAAKPGGERLALVGATLLRAGEAPLVDAVVLVENGHIASIGTDPSAAAGAKTLELRGKLVSGGLIDPLTRVGVTEVDLEDTGREDALSNEQAVSAGFAVADGYDPSSPIVAITRREGLTSVGVLPVEGLVAGQSAWADLDGETPSQALTNRSLALHILLDDYAVGHAKVNHATALYQLRELFDDANAFREKREDFEKRQLRKLAASRRDLEVVVRALEGKLPVVFHVDRASDILNVLAFAKAYKLRVVVASAAEGWKVAGELAAAKVAAIVYPLDEGPRDLVARAAREDNAALLSKAGVLVAMSTGESHNARKLRQCAGNAVRAGMPHAAAIAAVTDAPARIFGLEAYGSPKVGRVANLAVWSGDPLEVSSRCERLVIRGREVSLRSRQTALFEKYR